MVAISSEAALFRLIDKINQGEDIIFQLIDFESFAPSEIRIVGDRFDGSMPTGLMCSLIEQQQIIDSVYAIIKHGRPRQLTKQEQKVTEIVFQIRQGSLTFSAILRFARALAGNLNSRRTVIIYLAFLAMHYSNAAWKAYLVHLADEKEIVISVKLSEEETKRLVLIKQMLEGQPMLQEIRKEVEQNKKNILKILQPKDTLEISRDLKISGDVAGKLLAKPRGRQIHDHIEGKYYVLSITRAINEKSYKAIIHNIDTRQETKLTIPADTLNQQMMDELIIASQERKQVLLKINVIYTDKRIRSATLIRDGVKFIQPD